VQRAFVAPRAGWVQRVATRDVGLACIELGGGRHKTGDAIDPRVGFTQVAAPGDRVEAGGVLAMVHAASEADADMACRSLEAIFILDEARPEPAPVLVARVGHALANREQTVSARSR
jgi:thymidine phosphorylase